MNRLFEEQKWNYYVSVIPIMIFFIIFLIWASFSEVDEVVRGEGKVVPSGQTKVLQNFEGGIISKILLTEGDKVKKGDVIYNLSNAFFKADLKTKEIELLSFEASAIRLKSSIANKKSIEFPQEMKDKIPDIIENEKRIFLEDLENRTRKIEIEKDKVSQKKLALKEAENKFDNLSLELNLAQSNMSILENLYKKKVVSRKEYLSELSKKQSIVTRLDETRNRLPILKEEIEEAKKRVESVKSEIRSKLLKQYSSLKIEINKLIEKNRANKDRDLRKFVVSPVNGVINKLYFHTIGGIVKPGDKMAEITPIDDTLTIEAKIKTSDRALVWSGQDVSIEITAYDFSKYGLLKGKLVSISPDSFEDRSGNVFYIAKIRANDYEFAPDLPILPGMVANVNILTGKKTIIEYILKPLKNIKRNALSEQ
ncbi:HlyD family secretion protein/adhesin transport system membrane fusion protein [Malaciobacter marinus]|jgi:HlyD family secretion protein/adhesin transport system membrane fusion protein|uniref:HlyD family secretion protein/adhesin transport system membrane fusion protein n=1 Tax=Malaciobacter marinus TaxID=505249 RepID=A0AB37A142_9BACT|nr:HlyD family type I secretion periplasmic adaptor subunit [Malaciobacter marinus]PPK62934.1 HlyD family secretion protein/adhesin transport system membrane fusion protein [Malaciobacter marinus]